MITKKDSFFFQKVKEICLANAAWEIRPQMLSKVWENAGLIPPDSERSFDVKDRVSFVCFVRNYIVWFHTSFNRKTKQFTKKASFSIVISKMVNGGEERVMTRFIYRDKKGFFVERFRQYASYLLKELRLDWPLAEDHTWAILKEFPCDQFFWTSKKRKKIKSFFANAEMTYPLVFESEKERFYYHKVRREHRGIQRYRRDIRKPYRKRRKKSKK